MKLSIKEAARVLYLDHGMEEYDGGSLTADTVAEWVNQGLIKSSSNGNCLTINKSELDNFIKDLSR